MYTNTGLSARLTASGNGDVVFKMGVFVTKIRLRVLDEETSVPDMKLFEKILMYLRCITDKTPNKWIPSLWGQLSTPTCR